MLLNESEPTVLDANGNGVVQMRPDGSRERWYPTTASVIVVGDPTAVNPPQASFALYCGQTPTAANFVDATFTGSAGNSTDRITGRIIGRTADAYVWGVWTGGEPGAVATLTLIGEKSLT